MIILEFLIFVVSSGLFCSEKFRGHVWAVLVAGAVATGSSLLFVYDLGAKMTGHEKEPPVITKIVKQTVVKAGQTSQPSTTGRPHTCAAEYPADAARHGEEGVTLLGFRILTDGTVDAVKVLTSSGSEALDEAALKCVANWHYRPAIKDGQIVETNWTAKVQWAIPSNEAAKETTPKPEEQPKPVEQPAAKEPPPQAEGHAWYDIGSWFSSEPEKKSP